MCVCACVRVCVDACACVRACVCACVCVRDPPPHACEAVHGADAAGQRGGGQSVQRGQHAGQAEQHQVLNVEELDQSQRQAACLGTPGGGRGQHRVAVDDREKKRLEKGYERWDKTLDWTVFRRRDSRGDQRWCGGV